MPPRQPETKATATHRASSSTSTSSSTSASSSTYSEGVDPVLFGSVKRFLDGYDNNLDQAFAVLRNEAKSSFEKYKFAAQFCEQQIIADKQGPKIRTKIIELLIELCKGSLEQNLNSSSSTNSSSSSNSTATNKLYLESVYKLANIYKNKNADGKKIAFFLFQEAYEWRYPPATNALGLCYDQGIGVKRNQKQALKFFRLGHASGDAAAFYNFGWYCYLGLGGHQVDKHKGRYLISHAIALGDCKSILKDAIALANKKTKQSIEIAKDLFATFKSAANSDQVTKASNLVTQLDQLLQTTNATTATSTTHTSSSSSSSSTSAPAKINSGSKRKADATVPTNNSAEVKKNQSTATNTKATEKINWSHL